MTARGRHADDARWAPTIAYYRSALVAITLIAVALLFRRPDLLVLATPGAVLTVWSTITRPTREPSISDRLARSTVREGGATTWRVDIEDADGTDIATVAVPAGPWIEPTPWRGVIVSRVHGDSASAAITLRSTRWGHQLLGPLHVTATSVWGAFRYVARLNPRPLTTLPLPATFDAHGAVRPVHGLVGAHRSARPGEGSEFAGIRDYQAGDRMRRINWSRSLRTTSLQVNAASAEQDTHVELVIDAAYDLGVSDGVDGRASSLDTTVRAAGAIAQHYVERGDRVSVRCLDPARPLTVPPGTGRTHLRRILDTLARTTPIPARRFASAQAPTGATDMTVLLSPIVTSAVLDRAVDLSRHGRAVVVIDTLPEHLVLDLDPPTALAWRIRLLERRRELRAASDRGIAVVRWAGPGSLDTFLRDIARRSSAPRVRA